MPLLFCIMLVFTIINNVIHFGGDYTMKTFSDFVGESKFAFVRQHKQKETLVGGKADGMSWDDLLAHHKQKFPDLTLHDLLKERKLGLKVESEHTNDSKKAEEIVKDHIFEFPTYYSKLLIPAENKSKIMEPS
jgi:hypothetical protein